MSTLSRFRLGVAAAGAVVVLGGAAVGIAAAQTQPTPTPSTQQARPGYQAFIDALAKRLNITSANLESAMSQARADVGLPANGPAPGFGGPGGRGERGGFGLDLNAAATAIGIPVDQLRTELAGKSLAQVAQAHNKSAGDVATAMKNAAHTRIDQAVTAGRLTAAQAATEKQQSDQRIDQLVNQVVPQGGPGGPGGFDRRGGPGGFGGELNTAATAIGISVDQLRTELAGKSLAQVAQAHGKTANDVATALKNAAHQRIDQAVTAGRLTAAQATTEKQQSDQRIDQLVNQVVPQRTTTPRGEGGGPAV
jgi:3-methyladenine DNA glycosylase AlkD